MFYQFQHFGSSESFCKEYGKNFHFPAHLHQSFECITALSGELSITVDEKVYLLHRGEALLIFPNQIHAIGQSESTHMLCIFSPELIRAFSEKTEGKLPQSNFFRISESLLDEMDHLSDRDSKIKKKGVLYTICAAFDDHAVYETQKRDYKHLLHQIFAFVEENYRTDCSLETLTEHMPYSYAYLSRYFKNAVGMSYNSYVNQYRISRACYYLNNTSMSIVECAYEVGYTSLRSFNRNFRICTETTPYQTRKMKGEEGRKLERDDDGDGDGEEERNPERDGEEDQSRQDPDKTGRVEPGLLSGKTQMSSVSGENDGTAEDGDFQV